MLTNLSRNLWRAYQGSNVKDRVARYGNWFDASHPGDASGTTTTTPKRSTTTTTCAASSCSSAGTSRCIFAPLKPGETLRSRLSAISG